MGPVMVCLILAVLTTAEFSNYKIKRFYGCWLDLGERQYPGLEQVPVGHPLKCRSYCFDLEQLNKECTMFAVGTKCERSMTSVYEKYGDIKPLFTYQNDQRTYLLKERCRVDKCWKPQGRALYRKFIESDNEKHCRFICLETPDCYYQSYHEGKCYLGDWNFFEPGYEKGPMFKLSDVCKQESCWTRHNEKDVYFPDLVMQQADDDMACRFKCLQVELCSIYKWDRKRKLCYIMKKTNCNGNTTTNLFIGYNSDVTTYYYKNKCILE